MIGSCWPTANVLMPRDYIRASVRELARRYRPRRFAADRLPAARSLGRTRMRVPQHLSGALAVCRRRPRLRFRPGQDHAVAARRPGTRRRHRGARQGSRRRRRLDQDRARRRSQGAARRPAIRAAARLSQRRRGLESAVALGATAARKLPRLFPAGSDLGRRAADDRARRRRTWRSVCRRRSASPALGALWYGSEMLLAAAAGWHLSARYPLCCLARDLLLPVLFVNALRGDDFVWRGNEMQVERMRPRGMMALVRPAACRACAGRRGGFARLRVRMSYRSPGSDRRSTSPPGRQWHQAPRGRPENPPRSRPLRRRAARRREPGPRQRRGG